VEQPVQRRALARQVEHMPGLQVQQQVLVQPPQLVLQELQIQEQELVLQPELERLKLRRIRHQ
jgi:hypothetical protein